MIRVNATGCSLVDNLYGHVDFSTETYKRLTSRKLGDGGLFTGGLVFSEAFADFADADYKTVLKNLTGTSTPDNSNIGGPGIVPVIHAAQVTKSPDIFYRFAGITGRDENGRRFIELLEKAGFPLDDYSESDLPTPSTDVLSDPTVNNGRGERTFINTIGAAGAYGPDSLPEDFFEADLLLFGGTALVPPLHDALDSLCRRGREAGAFVMVTTVFDFRNEARLQGKPWPLVDDYTNIDLLVVDREEALKISGEASPKAAMKWFLEQGCRGVVVTQGPNEILLGTRNNQSGPFLQPRRSEMPTCRYADEVVAGLSKKRDTTGCGDNFVGGLIDSLAHQLDAAEKAEKAGTDGRPCSCGSCGSREESRADSRADCQNESRADSRAGKSPSLDLEEAVISGVAAGSVALTCLGGVYYENEPGEKIKAMEVYFEAYRWELGEINNENEAARDGSGRPPQTEESSS